MADRAQLVSFWRARLLANQALDRAGSPRLHWLRQTYMRIYRFLLSQYGEANKTDPTASPDNEASLAKPAELCETPSSMPLVDNTRDLYGRPPKSPGKIQAVLKDLHNANDRDDRPGPLAKGLADDDWLVVASRRERWIPHDCVQFLRDHGIAARTVSRGPDVVVEVAREDVRAATALLARGRWFLRTSKQAAQRGRQVFLSSLLGGFAGLVAGMMFWLAALVVLADPASSLTAIPAAIVVAGFLLGSLLGGIITARGQRQAPLMPRVVAVRPRRRDSR